MSKATLICGGAGFIGTNLAHRLASQGGQVILYDNLSRPGVEKNLEWLKAEHGHRLEVHVADMLDRRSLRKAVAGADQVFNFAAQVAVTTSLVDPIDDFERNARGTLNLLEEIRRMDQPPSLIFTSTNKVYGGLEDVSLKLRGERYEPEDSLISRYGISEKRPLDFHSPYGCSKGCADQYVLDYARSFGLKTAVFRMSCIYGFHQCGNEDQGWVAHFLIKALQGEPITIYGDGKQVRDILFVEDLVDAFLLAQSNIEEVRGQAFNIGGGPSNTVSLLELLDVIEKLDGRRPRVAFDGWRTGDQRCYISDTRKFRLATGWKPRYSAPEGIEALYRWLGGEASGTVPTLKGEVPA